MLDPTFFKNAFEVNLFILFGACLLHSLITHGWQRTTREFTAGFILTLFCETTGVLSGAYVYPGFNFYILSVPFVNPAAWVALIYIIMHISSFILESKSWFKGLKKESIIIPIFALAFVDATIALGLDLILDPLASIYNWWIWVPVKKGIYYIDEGMIDPYNFKNLTFLKTPEGPVKEFFSNYFVEGFRYPTRLLGIPLINFIAWFIFVFCFSFQFRHIESKTHWNHTKKTIVLWLLIIVNIPILCFILIAPNI